MPELRKLRSLVGHRLRARDGEVGSLAEVFFDDLRWVVRYFVVKTGGWLTGRRVLIVPTVVRGVDDEAHMLDVDLTREQIEHCPPVATDLPVSRHYEEQYFRYYGWEPYWIGDPMLAPIAPAPVPRGQVPEEPEHPHLRSSHEVTGYRLRARDGEVGHVEDFILEPGGWAIRYLEVDTRNWLPGKHVLVAPTWLGQIDWAGREVSVQLEREAVKSAPPYDPSRVISRDYQVALYKHYGTSFEDG